VSGSSTPSCHCVPVVKEEANDARGSPSRSRIPTVALTGYNVEVAIGAEGVKVAVRPSDDTEIVPVREPIVNVEVVTVSGSIRLLKCSWITEVVNTPVVWFAGVTLVTAGVAMSAVVPVVKVLVTGAARAFPAMSCTPATVTVKVVFGARGSTGSSVSFWLLFDNADVTLTVPALASVI